MNLSRHPGTMSRDHSPPRHGSVSPLRLPPLSTVPQTTGRSDWLHSLSPQQPWAQSLPHAPPEAFSLSRSGFELEQTRQGECLSQAHLWVAHSQGRDWFSHLPFSCALRETVHSPQEAPWAAEDMPAGVSTATRGPIPSCGTSPWLCLYHQSPS